MATTRHEERERVRRRMSESALLVRAVCAIWRVCAFARGGFRRRVGVVAIAAASAVDVG